MPRTTRTRHWPLKAIVCGLAVFLCAGCVSTPNHDTVSNMGAETFRGQRSPLSEAENSANCNGLKTAMQTHANEIKAARARMVEELKAPAPSLDRMSRRASGEEGGGTVAFDQIKTERHVMAALNARLSDKGCPTVDVAQMIAATAAPAAKPCTNAPLLKPGNGKPPKQAAGTANTCA
jgi:hypothetical protein